MTITVYSTRTNAAVQHETSATTWGALRDELSAAGLINSDMRAILRETKVTLENKDIVMPTEPYTIFVTPVKTKSGSGKASELTVARIRELKKEIDQVFELAIQDLNNAEKQRVVKLQKECDDILKGMR